MKRALLTFSIFYFFSVSLYSFILAFFPIYCRNIGLSAFEIAVITSFGTLATVIGAPLSLHLCHHLIPARKLFLACLLLSICLYLPLFFASTALTVGASWLLFNLLKRSADAIVDAGAIRASSLGSFQFESTRMWGSVGFVVATLIFGFFVDYFGQSIILYGGATIVVLVFLSGLPLWSELSKSTGKSVELNDLGEFLQAKDFMLPFALITTAFCLITASHACMYVYFSLYLEALGWSASAISFAWNLGVCSEILMFIFFRHFERKLGLQTTFMISCAITASRWFLLGFSNDSSLILALQLLHSFSFGGCYLCAAKLVPRILPNHLADRGQGVMIAIGFGIGSFAGRLLFGFLADGTSSYLEVQQLFISAGYIAVIATALSVMFRMKKLKVAPESVSDDQAPA